MESAGTGPAPATAAAARSRVVEVADRLIAAQDRAELILPITAGDPGFDVPAAYDVLDEIEGRRRRQGWQAVGRKIGFTNRTLWPRYGVFQPMWAHLWRHTVHDAEHGRASLPLGGMTQPRIEPEVVFKLRRPPAAAAQAAEVLAATEWIAPGFEIVHCHFPDWKFSAADCTADCGLHGQLVVGTPLRVTEQNAIALAALLRRFTLTLRRDRELIDTGGGANVLDSPALALAHLARLLSSQPQFPPLSAGEIVTTGTLTDAWPVAPGDTWSSDYGALGLESLTVAFR